MRRPLVQDTALAVTLLLLSALVKGPDAALGEAGPLWWFAALLATAGVALRRRWPAAMLAVCCLAAMIHLSESMPLTIVNLSVPILLYTLATRRGWAVSLAVLAGLLVLAVGSSSFAVLKHVPPPAIRAPVRELPEPPERGPIDAGPIDAGPVDAGPVDAGPVEGDLAGELTDDGRIIAWNDLPGLILILVAAWAVGSGTRSRRAYLAELRARAVDRERERGQQAVLAIAAERGRISRELHDVVAHGLSVMVIQAQGGAAALDNRPDDTRAALEAIIKTGRDSLADMRRVLATVGEVDDAWHPQPGLAMLPALVDQVREAGTPVSLTIDDPSAELPSAVDLSAYRIVQEALTNIIKHGGTRASAAVTVSRSATAVHITVRDDGPGPTAGDGKGTGLRGMRERVRLLGGRFDAGPGPSGGFVVRAELPVEE